MLRRFGIVGVVVVVVAAAGCGGGGGRASPSSADVVRVVDGDTIVVAVVGREERVRYIGVDTPETVKPDAPVECFGRRASARNHALVDGERVRLVYDDEQRDRFGRLLAYVFRERDGLFVNASLVQDGYARVLTIRPNTAHRAQFERDADAARRAGRGLWNACPR